jgi:hypothetical protein
LVFSSNSDCVTSDGEKVAPGSIDRSGAVVALGAILLTGANLYVQSQGTHAKIQQELSRRLGATLGIRSMSVTPGVDWS